MTPAKKTVPLTGIARAQALAAELQATLKALGPVAGPVGVPEALAVAGLFLDAARFEDEEALLREVLGQVARLVNARAGCMTIEVATRGRLTVCLDTIDAQRHFERAGRAAIERATGEAVFIADLALDPRFASDAAAANLGAAVAVPGGLALARAADAGGFERGDAVLLTAVMAYISRALPVWRQLRDQSHSELRFDLLNRLYETLAKSLALDDVLDQIARITLELTRAERVFVLLKAHDQLFFGAGHDRSGVLTQQATRDISRTVCRKVVDTGEGLHVLDLAQDAEFGRQRSVVNLRITSVAAVPLKGPEGVSGVLYVDARNDLMNELGHSREALEAIGRVASLAVESARLYHQATVDALTGLYVRSFFMLRLEEELKRARRYQRPFALLMLDIDHFKAVNDGHGHQVGDEAIKLVAGAVTGSIRAGVDLAGRYGGDEMLVMLPETPPEGAMIVAERIRALVAAIAMPLPGVEPVRVTTSIGLVTYPGGGESGTEMFANADVALYEAKAAGRNQVRQFKLTPAR